MRIRNGIRLLAAVLLAAALASCGGGDGSGDDGESSAPPTAEAGGFDLSSAVALLQLCLESYQMLTDFEQGRSLSLPAPYTLQAQFDTDEHFPGEAASGRVPIAFVATRGSAIYVVFRGTKTISEWVSDATFGQVDYDDVPDGGRTEAGFTAIHAGIRTAIIAKVASLAGSGAYTTLYVTGHSLGGALAVLAAPDLAAHTPLPHPVVYTFAGPRAGNPAFALRYNRDATTSWRVVNTYDEAPRLPNAVTTVFGPPPERRPELLFYDHVDREYPITFGGPIRSVDDLIHNHSSCNYYATLCAQTSDPNQCRQAAEGVNGCKFS